MADVLSAQLRVQPLHVVVSAGLVAVARDIGTWTSAMQDADEAVRAIAEVARRNYDVLKDDYLTRLDLGHDGHTPRQTRLELDVRLGGVKVSFPDHRASCVLVLDTGALQLGSEAKQEDYEVLDIHATGFNVLYYLRGPGLRPGRGGSVDKGADDIQTCITILELPKASATIEMSREFDTGKPAMKVAASLRAVTVHISDTSLADVSPLVGQWIAATSSYVADASIQDNPVYSEETLQRMSTDMAYRKSSMLQQTASTPAALKRISTRNDRAKDALQTWTTLDVDVKLECVRILVQAQDRDLLEVTLAEVHVGMDERPLDVQLRVAFEAFAVRDKSGELAVDVATLRKVEATVLLAQADSPRAKEGCPSNHADVCIGAIVLGRAGIISYRNIFYVQKIQRP